jgi:hypothetical protein
MATRRIAKNGPSCNNNVTRIDQISERRSFADRLRTKNLTLAVTDLRDACFDRDAFHDACNELRELTDGRGIVGSRRILAGGSTAGNVVEGTAI